MIEVKNVFAWYDETPVLNGFTMNANSGEVIALIGKNGTGKTTIFRSILNQMPRKSGTVLVNGTDISNTPTHRIHACGVGFVPQGRGLFEEFSVGDHFKLFKLPRQIFKQRLSEVKERFPIVDRRWNQLAGTLSGGEAKQVSLALANIAPAKVVLLDEPTANLSQKAFSIVADCIDHWTREGVCIVIVEHNLDFVLRVADRVHVIERGESILEATPFELQKDNKRILRDMFGFDSRTSTNELRN